MASMAPVPGVKDEAGSTQPEVLAPWISHQIRRLIPALDLDLDLGLDLDAKDRTVDAVPPKAWPSVP